MSFVDRALGYGRAREGEHSIFCDCHDCRHPVGDVPSGVIAIIIGAFFGAAAVVLIWLCQNLAPPASTATPPAVSASPSTAVVEADRRANLGAAR